MLRLRFLLAAMVLPLGPPVAQALPKDGPDVGTKLTQADLAQEFAIAPDGAGLPPGGGTAAQGQAVYAQFCSACHGGDLQGEKAIGAPALIGGRGTLAYVPVLGAKPAHLPVKTVESYWPYATTLFDYIKRAMPMNAPGSLGNDQVYAVTAYILAQAGVLKADGAVSAADLAAIEMPNRGGFRPYEVPKAAMK